MTAIKAIPYSRQMSKMWWKERDTLHHQNTVSIRTCWHSLLSGSHIRRLSHLLELTLQFDTLLFLLLKRNLQALELGVLLQTRGGQWWGVLLQIQQRCLAQTGKKSERERKRELGDLIHEKLNIDRKKKKKKRATLQMAGREARDVNRIQRISREAALTSCRKSSSQRNKVSPSVCKHAAWNFNQLPRSAFSRTA